MRSQCSCRSREWGSWMAKTQQMSTVARDAWPRAKAEMACFMFLMWSKSCMTSTAWEWPLRVGDTWAPHQVPTKTAPSDIMLTSRGFCQVILEATWDTHLRDGCSWLLPAAVQILLLINYRELVTAPKHPWSFPQDCMNQRSMPGLTIPWEGWVTGLARSLGPNSKPLWSIYYGAGKAVSTWQTVFHLILPTVLSHGYRFPFLQVRKPRLGKSWWFSHGQVSGRGGFKSDPEPLLNHFTVLSHIPLLTMSRSSGFKQKWDCNLGSYICPLDLSTHQRPFSSWASACHLSEPQMAPELPFQNAKSFPTQPNALHESTVMTCTFQHPQWNLVFALIVVSSAGHGSAFCEHRTSFLLLSPVPSTWQGTRDSIGLQGVVEWSHLPAGLQEHLEVTQNPIQGQSWRKLWGWSKTCPTQLVPRHLIFIYFTHWSSMS